MRRKVIIITNHGLLRWNQRVKRQEKEKIINYIKKHQIEKYYNDFYLIDDDIVVKLEITKYNNYDLYKVITVFGRISDNPALNNIKEFIRCKKKYGRMCKKIN